MGDPFFVEYGRGRMPDFPLRRDTVFDIEITPNRPDCLSHLGIARELSAWFKLPLLYPAERFTGGFEAGTAARPDLLKGVRVEAPEDWKGG